MNSKYTKELLSILALLGVVAFAACSAAEEPAATEEAAVETVTEAVPDEGFVSLYNGENLDGWHRHETVPDSDVGGKWEVIDGVIAGDQDPPGRGGFLVTDGKYKDFVVEMEINLDYPTDSGVFLRMGEDGKSHQVTLDNVEDGDFGAIYLPWTQGSVQENPEGETHYKQGEWNKVRVQIQGEPAHIQFWLNDVPVTDFQHTVESTAGVPAEGYLGIQIHPGERWKEGNKVRFRNIRIREL